MSGSIKDMLNVSPIDKLNEAGKAATAAKGVTTKTTTTTTTSTPTYTMENSLYNQSGVKEAAESRVPSSSDAKLVANLGTDYNSFEKNYLFMEGVKMMMEFENPSLKKEVVACIKTNNWSAYDKVGLSVYSDLGVAAFGFGCRQPHRGIDAHVLNMKGRTFKTTTKILESEYKSYVTQKSTEMYSDPPNKICKTKWETNSVILPYSRDGKNISSSLKAAYMTALWTFIDRAIGMINIFVKEPIYKEAYNPLVMNVWELAALTDFVYNIRWGNNTWYPGSKDGKTLRNAVIAHQTAKVQKASAAKIQEALEAVGAAFMTYTGVEGKSNKGLARRRAAEYDMYCNKPMNFSRSDKELDTLTTSLGVKPEDIVMIGTDDSARIEAADSVWKTVMGNAPYPPEVIQALQTGSVEKFISEMQIVAQKEAEAREEAARNLAKNDNGEKKNAIEIIQKTENINLYPIADGRAMSGMSIHTTTMHGSSEENARSRKNLTQQIGAFKKYGQVNDEDLGQAKSTLFFVTRPEMCLYQNTNGKPDSSMNFFEPSLQMRDPDLIDHLKIDRDLYIMLDRHIKPDFTETNIAFIPAFTNQFRSATPPEVNFEFDKSAANIHGVSLSLPIYNSSDSADSSIPVTFNVDNNLSVMKYVDLIFKYAKSKKEGLTLPWKNVVKYNVIDFSMTLFMFTVGQDGVTLESWERSVGVIPSNNPLSSIPKNSQPEKMESVNINFKTNTNLDSRKLSIIHHFNFLNRIGCAAKEFTLEKEIGKVKSYDEAIDWYMINYNIIETWVQDNMEYEDWYCERYQIFLDTDGVHHSYKIVGIPTWKRLKYILTKFVNDTRLRKLLAVDEIQKTQTLRFSKSSLYKKYGLNISAFKDNTTFKNELTINKTYNDTILNLDKVTENVMTENKKSTTVKSFSDGFGLGHKQYGTVSETWLENNDELKSLQGTSEWTNVLKGNTILDSKHNGVSDFTMTVDKDNQYNVTADGKTFKFDKFKYDLFIAPRKSTTYFSKNTMFNEKTGLFIMKDNDEIYTKGVMDAFTLQKSVPYVKDFEYDKATKIDKGYALDLKYGRFMVDGYSVDDGIFLEYYLKYMATKYKKKYNIPLDSKLASHPGDWRLDITHTDNLYVKDSRVGGSAPFIKDGKVYRKKINIVTDINKSISTNTIYDYNEAYMQGLNIESNSMRSIGKEVIETLDRLYYKENFGKLYEDMMFYLKRNDKQSMIEGISSRGKTIPLDPYILDIVGLNAEGNDIENMLIGNTGVTYAGGGMLTRDYNKSAIFGDKYIEQLEVFEKDKSENASLNENMHDKQKQLLGHFEEKKIPIFPDSSTTIRIGAWGFNTGAMADSLIDTAKASLANWAANNLSNLVTKKLTELVVGKDNINKDKHDNGKYRMSDKDIAMLAKLKGYESLSIDTKNAEVVSYTEYQENNLSDNEGLPTEEYVEKPIESKIEFPKIEPVIVEEKYTPVQFKDLYTYKDDNGASFKLDIDDKTLKAINSLLKKRNVNDFDEEYNNLLKLAEKSIDKLTKVYENNIIEVYTKVSDILSNNAMYDMYVDNKQVFDDAMVIYTKSTSENISKISGSTKDISDIILAALE